MFVSTALCGVRTMPGSAPCQGPCHGLVCTLTSRTIRTVRPPRAPCCFCIYGAVAEKEVSCEIIWRTSFRTTAVMPFSAPKARNQSNNDASEHIVGSSMLPKARLVLGRNLKKHHLGALHWLLQSAERHWTITEVQREHFYFILPSPTTP